MDSQTEEKSALLLGVGVSSHPLDTAVYNMLRQGLDGSWHLGYLTIGQRRFVLTANKHINQLSNDSDQGE